MTKTVKPIVPFSYQKDEYEKKVAQVAALIVELAEMRDPNAGSHTYMQERVFDSIRRALRGEAVSNEEIKVKMHHLNGYIVRYLRFSPGDAHPRDEYDIDMIMCSRLPLDDASEEQPALDEGKVPLIKFWEHIKSGKVWEGSFGDYFGIIRVEPFHDGFTLEEEKLAERMAGCHH